MLSDISFSYITVITTYPSSLWEDWGWALAIQAPSLWEGWGGLLLQISISVES